MVISNLSSIFLATELADLMNFSAGRSMSARLEVNKSAPSLFDIRPWVSGIKWSFIKSQRSLFLMHLFLFPMSDDVMLALI